jgi:hypothetical protein
MNDLRREFLMNENDLISGNGNEQLTFSGKKQKCSNQQHKNADGFLFQSLDRISTKFFFLREKMVRLVGPFWLEWLTWNRSSPLLTFVAGNLDGLDGVASVSLR